MIDPKELRLGNWIVIDDGPYTQVDIATLTALLENPKYTRDFYHPIPISPEWLERLGFEMVGDDKGYYWIACGENTMLLYDLDFHLAETGVDYNERPQQMKHIKHVHQLMNLYYAITGEELQIKEK